MEISRRVIHSAAAAGEEIERGHDRRPAHLREIYGEPNERAVKKQLSRFDRYSRDFIARSPFLVIASSDPSGRCDASPKGDAPGFVRVIDDTTLLIPDRIGNNRVDTLGNLVARPGVGLIFFVPGLPETLRVNGRGGGHDRSGVARTARSQRQDTAQRHPGDGRRDLFPLRQGADPLRFVEPAKAAAARRFPVDRPHRRRADRRHQPRRGRAATAESYRNRLY